MALDPSIIDTIKEIGYLIGASIFGGGTAVGSLKYMDGKKQADTPPPSSAPFCSEHKELFREIKDELKEHGKQLGGLQEDVAYIRGAIDRR